MLFHWLGDRGDSCLYCFQVAGHTATGVSGVWVSSCALSVVLGYDLGVQRFLAPLFAVPPLSKHLGEVESVLWLVPAHRVAIETSLLCLILVQGPQPTFCGTSSQAHLLTMSLNVAKCNLGKVTSRVNASSSLPNKYACGVATGVCLATCC